MARVEVDLRKATAALRAGAAVDAARVLEAGEAVIAPGDTGDLVLAAVGGQAGAGIGRAAGECAAWVAPEVDALLRAAAGLTRVGRKLIRQFAPGPVVWKIGMDEASLAAARQGLGADGPGVVDDGRFLHARVCGASMAATVVSRTGRALCAWEPGDDGEAGAAGAAASAGINVGMALRDAGGGAGKRATVIALERSGAVRVEREGAFEKRYVQKHVGLNVLMVCTGNTCRSPMAEAIATGMAQKELMPVKLSITSAGVGAGGGAARTPEGAAAVRALGYEAGRGTSRPLTRQMIAEADVIYGLTRSHVAGVLAMEPGAADKVFLLDPEGHDVADPIGMAQKAYNDTAKSLRRMISQRIKEWRS